MENHKKNHKYFRPSRGKHYMKRGRPSARGTVKSFLLDMLGKSQVPLTTTAIRRTIIKEAGRDFSWNTIQKYLDELVRSDTVGATALPHSKDQGRTGLTVYTLKKQ